jgi:hypothetical protein
VRAPAAALAAVLLATTVGGCGLAERREARQSDDAGAVLTGDAPAPEDGGAADPGAPQDPEEIVPTDGLTEEDVVEIETALIDAEAALASLEAELAQDE